MIRARGSNIYIDLGHGVEVGIEILDKKNKSISLYHNNMCKVLIKNDAKYSYVLAKLKDRECTKRFISGEESFINMGTIAEILSAVIEEIDLNFYIEEDSISIINPKDLPEELSEYKDTMIVINNGSVERIIYSEVEDKGNYRVNRLYAYHHDHGLDKRAMCIESTTDETDYITNHYTDWNICPFGEYKLYEIASEFNSRIDTNSCSDITYIMKNLDIADAPFTPEGEESGGFTWRSYVQGTKRLTEFLNTIYVFYSYITRQVSIMMECNEKILTNKDYMHMYTLFTKDFKALDRLLSCYGKVKIYREQ